MAEVQAVSENVQVNTVKMKNDNTGILLVCGGTYKGDKISSMYITQNGWLTVQFETEAKKTVYYPPGNIVEAIYKEA